jgi:murein DD-endopeptidase MepM/ murein hydrolase activator NlpD
MRTKTKLSYFLILFYSSILILFSVVIAQSLFPPDDEQIITEIIHQEEPVNQFGFNDYDLVETIKNVQRNETLSDIFNSFNIGDISLDQIINKTKKIFNVRSIREGRPYHSYVTDDSLSQLKYLVYQIDYINFLIFDFNDSLLVYKGTKQIEQRKNTFAATINNSLYASLNENGASIELALKLSQIFAWQVDFYSIQRGDFFKVIYEENLVDGKVIGIGNIAGAYFNHKGQEYYAIPFEQDSVIQFFDQYGNSLRKAFLKAPLEFSRISSRFSKNRFHPILKRNKPHLGTDYAAPHGTPIRTIGDGIVVEAGYSGGNGNYVKVKHNSTYSTQYLHMSRFAKGIRKGATVKQGQVIGYVGSTGMATGPHLCFRFWKNGIQVDPYKEKNPPSFPVKKEMIAQFDSVKSEIISELDNMEKLAASL